MFFGLKQKKATSIFVSSTIFFSSLCQAEVPIYSPEDLSPSQPPALCKYAKLSFYAQTDSGFDQWANVFGANSLDIFSRDYKQTSNCMAGYLNDLVQYCTSYNPSLLTNGLKIATNVEVGHEHSWFAGILRNSEISEFYPPTRILTAAETAKLNARADAMVRLSNAGALNLTNMTGDDCIVGGIASGSIFSNGSQSGNLDWSNNNISQFIGLFESNSYSVVFDENCKALTNQDASNLNPNDICPDLAFRQMISPISLNWSEATIDNE